MLTSGFDVFHGLKIDSCKFPHSDTALVCYPLMGLIGLSDLGHRTSRTNQPQFAIYYPYILWYQL